MKLHPNAAVRVIRNEIERLTVARVELVLSLNDPRIPRGVMADQMAQCDREMEELFDALLRLSPPALSARPPFNEEQRHGL
jgi:hypothetical protein